MKSYQSYLFPIFLFAMGLIAISGIELFGSALLEGAAWKQNVIFALLIIFGMLPPAAREMKATWMVAGYALAFFMFGGANIIGTVGVMLALEKIALAVLVLFMGFRLWSETWKANKLYMLAPVLALLFVAILFPIQDQNIVGSGLDALLDWSADKFTSDKGFHIYLGLVSLLAGVTEILILRESPATVAAAEETVILKKEQ